MKKQTLIFIVLASTLLQSCASGPDLSDPSVREAMSKVQFYESNQLTGKEFTKIGTVDASICTTNNFSSGHSTEATAKSELIYKVSKLGGNGLTNYLCQSEGISLSKNCNNSTVCYADAIIVK